MDRHGGRHWVQLPEWLLATEAWRALSVGARALYVELKRRYRGDNNGTLRLSHREAAGLLGLHRNSVGRLFDELEDKGFIRKLEGHHLGPSGIGQTARWALDEYPTATDRDCSPLRQPAGVRLSIMPAIRHPSPRLSSTRLPLGVERT